MTSFFSLSLLGIVPANNGGRGGGSGRGRGGNRRPQNQPEISEADKAKVKLYKHKYEKYLKLKPITNSPFDILVKAAQVQSKSFSTLFSIPPKSEETLISYKIG